MCFLYVYLSLHIHLSLRYSLVVKSTVVSILFLKVLLYLQAYTQLIIHKFTLLYIHSLNLSLFFCDVLYYSNNFYDSPREWKIKIGCLYTMKYLTIHIDCTATFQISRRRYWPSGDCELCIMSEYTEKRRTRWR